MHRFFCLLLFLATACTTKVDEHTDIIIVPLGNIPAHQVDSVQGYLKDAFGIYPQQITPIKLPESAFVNVKSPRYRADSLLVYLNKIRKAEGADFAFGITTVDISTTKRDANGNIKKPAYKYSDWGIMGLAYRPGRTAVVSTFRLDKIHPEFHQRLKKISIHEFGHNLGLPHCPDKNCVMTDAVETIKTVDNCNAAFCAQCFDGLF